MGLRTRLRGINRRRSGSFAHGIVLMYHRIGPDLSGGGLAVSPSHFGEHLRALRSAFHPVSLAALVRSLGHGGLPPRSVAITFDDGYLDNLVEAKPLLEHWNVPATVFVVSGYVGSGKRFWWDELEEICLGSNLPDELELDIGGRLRKWKSAPEQPRDFFRGLREALGPLQGRERDEMLKQLWHLCGRMPSDFRETLSADELRQLAKGGLVEIGAHTVTHPSLTDVPSSRQVNEIRSSRLQLTEFLDQDVRLFSYPFGAYDATVASSARAAEVSCACTTIGDAVDASTDPYRLPRLHVDDCSPDELTRRIATVSGWTV